MDTSPTTLQHRLNEVTRLMEAASTYTAWDLHVWTCLSARVDTAHFARTGQILTAAIDLATLLDDAPPGCERSIAAVPRALAHLNRRGHLAPVASASHEPPRYRLFLPCSAAVLLS